ncbi:MAG: GAF domain-containing sensor histidine kinase [Candidatus Geothermincolia bacterium]
MEDIVKRFTEQREQIIDEMLSAYAEKIPIYRRTSPALQEQIREMSRETLDHFLHHLERGEGMPEFSASVRARAAQREVQGFAMDAVLRAFWVGQAVAWRHLRAWLEESDRDSEQKARLLFDIWDEVQQVYLTLALAVTEGYMQARGEADNSYNRMLNGFRSTLDRSDLLRRVTQEICRTLGYQRAILFFYEDAYEDGLIRAVSAHDAGDPDWGRHFLETFQPTFFTMGDNLEARALFNGTVVVVNRSELDPLVGRTSLVCPEVSSAFALAPITPGHSPAALLFVEQREGLRQISARGRELLAIFCDTVGFALENSRLYHEVLFKGRSLNHLMSRVNTSQEEERQRIARDLHDVVAQSLLKVIYSSTFALDFIKEDPALAVEEIEDIREKARESLSELRNIISDLRPSSLEILGLQETLRRYTEKFEEETGIITNANLEEIKGLEPQAELAVFRIFQEALANVRKHAQAREVTIDSTKAEGGLTMIIRDNGVGFNPSRIEDHQSRGERLGLLAMRERAELLGGNLEIESLSGYGTTVTIRLPIKES